MLAKEIIAQMPDDIRARAEAKAAESGMTLVDFVQEQVTAQLTEEELDAISGGRDAAVDTSVGVRYDFNPVRVDHTVGVGGRFRF